MNTDTIIYLSFTIPSCIALLIAVIKDPRKY